MATSPRSNTQPIPISSSRTRSSSIASSIPALSTSPSSPLHPSLATPSSLAFNRLSNRGPSSPIASYFPSSPFHTKAQSTSALDDDDSPPPRDIIAHVRRASTSTSPWTPLHQPSPVNERGAAIMRRLSLSVPFQPPSIPDNPPPSAVSPSTLPPVPNIAHPVPRKKRAMSTATTTPPKKRSISPMGERLLKGHFDGF